MDVDRADRLATSSALGFGERVLRKQRAVTQGAIRRPPEDVQLVLPLQRHEVPPSRWMKIQMPDLKFETAAWSNREPIRQHTAFVIENLDGARVFWFGSSWSVPPRHQNDGLIRRVHADLMRVDPHIDRPS